MYSNEEKEKKKSIYDLNTNLLYKQIGADTTKSFDYVINHGEELSKEDLLDNNFKRLVLSDLTHMSCGIYKYKIMLKNLIIDVIPNTIKQSRSEEEKEKLLKLIDFYKKELEKHNLYEMYFDKMIKLIK